MATETPAPEVAVDPWDLVDDGSMVEAAFPDTVATGTALPVDQLPALQAVPLTDLRDLTFPAAGDPTDAFLLQTGAGEGYVDQVSGQMVNWTVYGTARQVWEMMYKLHTGQGLWMVGLVLGLSALSVPLLSATGTAIYSSAGAAAGAASAGAVGSAARRERIGVRIDGEGACRGR